MPEQARMPKPWSEEEEEEEDNILNLNYINMELEVWH